MKKLPEDYKLRQNRIAKKRLSCRKKKIKSMRGTSSNHVMDLAHISSREAIKAPRIIAFYPKHAEETIQFVKSISKACSEKKVVLDFSSTEIITAAGVVYLFSELQLLREKSEKKAVIINEDDRIGQNVRGALRESGLLKLVNGQPQPTGRVLPVTYGKDDENVEEILEFLIEKAVIHQRLGTANPVEAEKLAGQAIREAMLNVKHHA